RCRDLPEHAGADPRVEQRLECFALRGIMKHEVAHRGAVEIAVVVEDAGAEDLANRREARLARRDDLARDDVRVDERCAELDEFLSNERFAACDSAGQADREHGRRPRGASVELYRPARTTYAGKA